MSMGQKVNLTRTGLLEPLCNNTTQTTDSTVHEIPQGQRGKAAQRDTGQSQKISRKKNLLQYNMIRDLLSPIEHKAWT